MEGQHKGEGKRRKVKQAKEKQEQALERQEGGPAYLPGGF